MALSSRVASARARVEGTWAEEFWERLKALDAFSWTTMFGAALIMSAIPLFVLLGALASHRIDGDLSRHLGLDRQGASIVATLFRARPSHDPASIILGLAIGAAGMIAVADSLQVLYERTFDLPRRGWRDLPRFVLWLVVLLGVLIAEGSVDGQIRRAAGGVVLALTAFLVATVFFAWTIHVLLAGRLHWRQVIRPAVLTAALWVALRFFSSLVFSDQLVSDSRLYGTIGVIFTLLSWFIAIGVIIILGAVGGFVWEERRGGAAPGAGVRAKQSA